MMKQLISYVCALCAGLLLASCSSLDEEAAEVVETNPQLEIVKVPVSIEAPFGSEAETRAMTRNNGFALYDFDKMVTDGTDLNILLCLKHTDGTLVYTDDLTGKLTKTSSGAYTISFSNAEVNIKAGTSLSDYTVCALLNTGIDGTKFKSAFIPASGSTSTTVDFRNLPYTDDEHSIDGMCVPMYSSYANSSLTVDANGNGKITLDFYMMGTVITAKVRNNPLAVPVKFSKFSFNKSNVRTGNATYTFGKENSSGDPDITFPNKPDTCTFKWAETADRELLPSFDGSTTDSVVGDFWCFPVDQTGFYQQYGLHYELENSNTTGTTYTADSINYYKGNGKTTAAIPNGMESGKCYKVGLALPASDLMITEYERLNINPNNYSMIEIYNPTNEVKDLRNYGLVRQIDLQYYIGPVRHNYTPTYQACGEETSVFDNARIQDLYISPSDKDKENEVLVSGALVSDNYSGYTNSYTLFADYQDGYEQNVTYKGITLQPYELGPGQTIVLFAAGTKALTGNDYYPSGSKYFNSSYLSTAIDKGDCKYAIAVDNGNTKNEECYTYTGGVLQAAQKHNIILVKYNGSKFETLDALFSLDPSNLTRSHWVWNYPENKGADETADNHRIVSRRPSVMYPYTIRPVDEYYNVTLHTYVANPLNGHIWDGFDWQYIFSSSGSYFNVNDATNGTLVSPGTRNVVESYK